MDNDSVKPSQRVPEEWSFARILSLAAVILGIMIFLPVAIPLSPEQVRMVTVEHRKAVLVNPQLGLAITVNFSADPRRNTEERERFAQVLSEFESLSFERVAAGNFKREIPGVAPRDTSFCVVSGVTGGWSVRCNSQNLASWCLAEELIANPHELVKITDQFIRCLEDERPAPPLPRKKVIQA